jgi:hypothetical protein
MLPREVSRRVGDQVKVGESIRIRTAVDEFVSLVAESHRQRPHAPRELDPDRDHQGDVLAALANLGVVPEEPRAMDGDCDDVQAVQRGGSAFPG